MHPVSRVVVMLLALGLAGASYCAQACNIPQLASSECPLHHHSDDTNCCQHSSSDATMTEKVECSVQSRSAVLLFVPVQSISTTLLFDWNMGINERYGPPNSVLQYPHLTAPPVLRV